MKIKRHNWNLLEQVNRLDSRLLPGGALQPDSWLRDYCQCSAFAVRCLGTGDTFCSQQQGDQPGVETCLRGKQDQYPDSAECVASAALPVPELVS